MLYFSIAKHLIFKNFSPRNTPQSKVELILNQHMNNIFESDRNTWVQLFKNRGLNQKKIEEIKQVPLY